MQEPEGQRPNSPCMLVRKGTQYTSTFLHSPSEIEDAPLGSPKQDGYCKLYLLDVSYVLRYPKGVDIFGQTLEIRVQMANTPTSSQFQGFTSAPPDMAAFDPLPSRR